MESGYLSTYVYKYSVCVCVYVYVCVSVCNMGFLFYLLRENLKIHTKMERIVIFKKGV